MSEVDAWHWKSVVAVSLAAFVVGKVAADDVRQIVAFRAEVQ